MRPSNRKPFNGVLRPLPAEPAKENRGKVGIFRGIAVERYVRPLEADAPETLARSRPGLALTGIVLTLAARWLLFR